MDECVLSLYFTVIVIIRFLFSCFFFLFLLCNATLPHTKQTYRTVWKMKIDVKKKIVSLVWGSHGWYGILSVVVVAKRRSTLVFCFVITWHHYYFRDNNNSWKFITSSISLWSVQFLFFLSIHPKSTVNHTTPHTYTIVITIILCSNGEKEMIRKKRNSVHINLKGAISIKSIRRMNKKKKPKVKFWRRKEKHYHKLRFLLTIITSEAAASQPGGSVSSVSI